MENLLTEYSVPSESNITLEVTFENLAPENGNTITALWFGLHDGSFNTFDVDSPASSGVENLAEDGITGLEGTVPGLIDLLLSLGLNPDAVPPQEESIAGLFAAETQGSTQGLVVPENFLGFIPGETVSTTIELEGSVDNNRFLSYGAMFFPSNDAFIADEEPIEIYDEEGNFVGSEIIILGNQVWDAGTEVNTESPQDVPFTVPIVDLGPEENGVIRPHPGFLPAGSGGVLDFNDGIFAESADDLPDPDLQVARITINPVINGTSDQDLLLGENNQERFNGFEGDDLIFGNDGDDTIDGGAGEDRLFGEEGNDYLLGSDGDDFIVGGIGDDFIDGGAGEDYLVGNIDADQFVLRLGDGQDTILDYQDSIDSFVLADGLEFEQLTITQSVGEAIISVTETHEELAVLVNTDANEITIEDFTNLGQI